MIRGLVNIKIELCELCWERGSRIADRVYFHVSVNVLMY
jgi:hypothetical protein